MRTLVVIVGVLVILLLSLALVGGVLVGLGWLLALFLPFSLFEATVVATSIIFLTGMAWRFFLMERPFPTYVPTAGGSNYREITWADWLEIELGEAVSAALMDWDGWSDETSLEALERLSFLLAQAVVAGLRKKPPTTKRLRVTPGMLRHEFSGEGRPPQELLNLVARVLSQRLADHEKVVLRVIREDLWERPAE